jgi:soluble lytic murein transglycosylase-like protein
VAPNPVANTTTNTTTNTPSTASIPWQSHIESAAALYGIDYFLLQAIVHAESRFIANAISPSGAVGLMQLMPPTAASVGALQGNRKAIRKQLLDPATNLRIGARYLKSLLQQFEGRLDLALAAYNAGAGNVKKAGNQVPNNRETPKFVAKVMQLYTDLRTSSLLRMPQDSAPPPTAATARSINSNTGATTGAPSTSSSSSSSSTSSSNSPPNTIATKASQPEPNPALSP